VPTYVVLLRGINLGSKRRVAMADLRELLEGLGYDDVRTHLQSGNVVLRTTGSAAAVKEKVEAALATHCGFDIDVVVRTKALLAKVIGGNPFTGKATDNARYLVVFREKAPPAAWLGRRRGHGAQLERRHQARRPRGRVTVTAPAHASPASPRRRTPCSATCWHR
jgi:hypothetical protein